MNKEQVLDKVIEIGTGFAQGLKDLAPDVMKEVISYYTFLTIVDIVSSLSISLAILFLLKTLNDYTKTLKEQRDTQQKLFDLDQENCSKFEDDEASHRKYRKTNPQQYEPHRLKESYAWSRFIYFAGFIIYFALSVNHYQDRVSKLGKIYYAPKLFLIEKAKELLEDKKPSKCG